MPSGDGLGLPPRIGGKYRPIRLIGQGGMGSVYEVEHEHTGQRLALKVIASSFGLAEDAVERFRTEARAAGRIRSDHVVRITDAGVAEELGRRPFLVMEMLEGADLHAVTQGVPTEPAEVVDWLRQVARGLSKAHALGVVHRDLKPENLFLTMRDDGGPLVKILDFGVAKVVAEGAGQTRSGQILGTPLYMAPEQAGSSDVPISTRTDGFALGLIAFKLLVGTPYWKTGSVVQIVSQVTLEPMVPASKRGAPFGPRFDEWFAKACAREANARFSDPIEQIEALANVFGIETALLPSSSSPGSGDRARADSDRAIENAPTLAASGHESGERPWRKRRAALLVSGAVVLAAFAVGIVRALTPGSPVATPSAASATAPGAAIVPDAVAPATSAEASAATSVSARGAGTSPAPTETADGSARRSAGGPARTAPAPPASVPRASLPRDPLEDQN